MCEPPFEPLESLDLRMLSYKMALLLLLELAKHMGDLHALSVHPSCMQFALDESKVALRPNATYTPKVLSGTYNTLPFELPALSTLSAEDRRDQALCPMRALRRYVEQTRAALSLDQLFVCFANPVRGSPSSAFHTGSWKQFLLHTRARLWTCLMGCMHTQQEVWRHHGPYSEEFPWRTFVQQLVGRHHTHLCIFTD